LYVEVYAVIRESLILLRQEPRIYIPRLLTTALYSIFMLASAGLIVDVSASSDPAALADALRSALVILALMPPLYLIDVLSYAMYPRIVSDYKSGLPISLRRALLDSLRAWRVLIALAAVVFAFLLVFSFISALFFSAAFLTGSILLLVASALVILILLLAFAIMMFFVVPSAVIDGRGVMGSFTDSIKLGLEHKWSLLKINVLFLALALLTLALGMSVQGNLLVSIASLAGFLAMRLMEAIVYTYLSVTNPMAYLAVRINNRGVE